MTWEAQKKCTVPLYLEAPLPAQTECKIKAHHGALRLCVYHMLCVCVWQHILDTSSVVYGGAEPKTRHMEDSGGGQLTSRGPVNTALWSPVRHHFWWTHHVGWADHVRQPLKVAESLNTTASGDHYSCWHVFEPSTLFFTVAFSLVWKRQVCSDSSGGWKRTSAAASCQRSVRIKSPSLNKSASEFTKSWISSLDETKTTGDWIRKGWSITETISDRHCRNDQLLIESQWFLISTEGYCTASQ